MFIFSAKVVLAIIIKELKILKRHPLQLFYELLLPFAKSFPAILLGKYLMDNNGAGSFSQTTGTDNSVLFLGLSILFTIFIDIQEQVGFYLEREMWMGTLEQLWITPVKKIGLIGGWITFATIKAVIYGLAACSLLFIFTANGIETIMNANFTLFFIVFVLLLLTSISNGIFISEISLRFRQSDSIIYFITFLIPVLSGVAYPIEVFPKAIRVISLLLPTTYAYDLMRHSLLNTYTIFELRVELIILIVLILIHMFVAIKLFDSLVKRLEKWGTIYLK
ncbi:MAG: ABC transporter permease [Eubacteriales bacterium]|nr:ABC transporter permease [Eubacteriales bacterium]